MKVVIVDYGMGNVHSLHSCIKHLGISDVVITSDVLLIEKADKIFLPGVGSFQRAMKNLETSGLDIALNRILALKNTPILGICLGMQLMTQSSTEGGITNGLSFVDASVHRFSDACNFSIPHVGFNQISNVNRDSVLFTGIPNCSDFYFTHSYRVQSSCDIGASFCEYGEEFIASFEVDNYYGVQFHPELSQYNGLLLLKNFLFNV